MTSEGKVGATLSRGHSTRGERPEVHASFLRWLATDKDAAEHIDPHGIEVAHATISDSPDLDFCKIPTILVFNDCVFTHEIFLQHAQLPALYLFKCEVDGGITGDGLTTTGDIFLRPVISRGEIRLLGAQIGGDLDCTDATLKPTGNALSADFAKITGTVVLSGSFSSNGSIRLVGSQIGGNLDCKDATLKSTGNVLFADGARIAGNVFLHNRFSSVGSIRLLNAGIGGQLVCTGATLKATGDALNANSAKIKETVFLNQGFSSAGVINLAGAEIGGALWCDGAVLSAPGDTLIAHQAKIENGG